MTSFLNQRGNNDTKSSNYRTQLGNQDTVNQKGRISTRIIGRPSIIKDTRNAGAYVSNVLPITEILKSKFVPNDGITYTSGVTLINKISCQNLQPMVVRARSDGGCWAIGYTKGVIKIFRKIFEAPCKLGMSEMPLTIKVKDEFQQVTDIRFLTKSSDTLRYRLIATYASGWIRVWECKDTENTAFLLAETQEITPNPLYTEKKDSELKVKCNTILCSSVSYDGMRFITGGTDGIIRVYETQDFTEIFRCHSTNQEDKVDGHTKQICAVKYHPLGETKLTYSHIFVSGGWDDTLLIWDDRHVGSLYQYYGPHVCGNDSLDIDGKENVILAGSWATNYLFYVYNFNHTALTGSDSRKMQRRFEKPVYQIVPKSVPFPCMTYVSSYLDTHLIIIGGGNNNAFHILQSHGMEVIIGIYDFPGAVISIDFHRVISKVKDKKGTKEKGKCKEYRIVICCENSIYILKVDPKAVQGTDYFKYN